MFNVTVINVIRVPHKLMSGLAAKVLCFCTTILLNLCRWHYNKILSLYIYIYIEVNVCNFQGTIIFLGLVRKYILLLNFQVIYS